MTDIESALLKATSEFDKTGKSFGHSASQLTSRNKGIELISIVQLPPRWKIRREIRRAGADIGFALTAVLTAVSDIFRRANYNARRATRVKITAGDVSALGEFAVFHIFQPKGLLPSTIETCRFLRSKGISPIVVSNAQLSEEDRNALVEVAHLIVERPNFGYDFGGYRDGLFILRESGVSPERVYLLNDSIWFPVIDDTDLIERLRAQSADVSGPIYFIDPCKPDTSHVQSYFISISGNLYASQHFWSYWENYAMTNYKRKVIRRGERGFSMAMRAKGFDVAGVHSSIDLEQVIPKLPVREMKEVNRFRTRLGLAPLLLGGYRARMDDAGGAAISATNTTDWIREYLLRAHPIIILESLGLPIIKKDRNQDYQEQRREIMALSIAKPELRFNPTILREVQSWDS